MKINNIISASQFSKKEVSDILRLAKTIQFCKSGEASCDAYRMLSAETHNCKNKIAATLFYEPSTRTRLSFEAAMYSLGGNVISTENASHFSSAVKGETLEDTISVVSSYANVIILRHPELDSAKRAVESATVPIINAGSGCGEHPTQALLDLFTIEDEIGRLDNFRIVLVGDLKYGRTIHSLVRLLGLYENVEVIMCCPEQLAIPDDVINFMIANGMRFSAASLHEALEMKPDIVYMTRIQTERDASLALVYNRQMIFGVEELSMLKEDAVIMHPLPRRGEITREVDADKRAAYFRQAANGVSVRAAILTRVL